MLHAIHLFFVLAYVTAPVVAVVIAIKEAAHDRARAAGRLFASVLIGSCLGIGATAGYAKLAAGHASGMQFFFAIYFATSVLILLNLLDAAARRISALLINQLLRSRQPVDQPAAKESRAKQFLAALLQMLLGLFRGAVLIAVGLPYMMSLAATYRPKVISDADPTPLVGSGFTLVRFPAADGLSISAWWIPATPLQGDSSSDQLRPGGFGSKTVILCHGFAGGKSTLLNIARYLLPAGYNVLALDFRAHGQSDGQNSSLGDLERRDVLGAVRWIREQHAEQASKIYGVGVNMGGAALIAAAADRGSDGQAIDAIAVYGAYDDLPGFASDLSSELLLWPMDWLTMRFGLPLASIQANTDLSVFKPSKLVNEIWPRPIFILHRIQDQTVDFQRGSDLFDSASQPKERLWLGEDRERPTTDDSRAARAIRRFFDHAVPVPVI